MSVRAKVAVALSVAALVPLLGVFAVVGYFLPNEVARVNSERLAAAAGAASTLLGADCSAVGDRAALVVSRLQVAVSVSDPSVPPRAVVAEAAPVVAADAAGVGDPWAVVVLDRNERVLAAEGLGADAVAADPGAYLDLSCSQGSLGSPASLTVALPVLADAQELGTEELGTVLAVLPLDGEPLDRIKGNIARTGDDLAVLESGQVAGATSGLDQGDTRVLEDVVPRLEPVDPDPAPGVARPSGEVQVGGRPVLRGPPVLGGEVHVAVVGEPSDNLREGLVLAFVITTVGAAVLVWLLASTLTRPLAQLAELARRIAAGDDPGDTGPEPGSSPGSDVQGVSAVLGSLARELRASEADSLARRRSFLDAFGRFGDALQQTHDRDGLLQTVLQASLLAAEAPMGVAMHHDRSSRLGRGLVSLRSASREEGLVELPAALRERLVVVAERALARHGVVEEPASDDLGPVLAFPLGDESRSLGAVVVARDAGQPAYDAVAYEAIGALSANAGTALANISDHVEVERLSVTDPLTGVANFRQLTTMLARELERAVRFGHPLGVLMLDIDHFKRVNDDHGHAAGDAVLRELARRVSECVREVDTVARYGGEEFALLLPETDLDGSLRLAERILFALRSEPFRLPDGPDVVITASIGVACYPEHGSSGTDLMRVADEALYEAKSRGRDRAVAADRARQPAERDSSP